MGNPASVVNMSVQQQPEADVISLNIGGTHQIMTSMAVLCQVKESKLCKYFEDIKEKQKLGDGSQVFLDRDGPAF